MQTEYLESRVLFSHGADDPIIIDDKAALNAHVEELHNHQQSLSQQMAADLAALKEAIHQRSLDVTPLVQQYNDDRAAGAQQLLDDKTTLHQQLADDKLAIFNDRQAIKQHRDDPAEHELDQARLDDDRTLYLSHAHAGAETIHQHRNDLAQRLHDDKQAIANHMHTESAGMIAARQQLDDHRHQGELELADDRNHIQDDRIKLRHDDGPNHS